MSMKPFAQLGNLIKTRKISRVLIIKLTSLGDVVHALPVAARLKETFPHLELHWVVEDRCAPLLENHPLLASVIVYPRKKIQACLKDRNWGQALKELWDLRQSLRRLDIQLSIDLQGLAKSGMMALMAWAPHRIGCSGLREISYWISRSLPEGRDLHAIDRNLKVPEFLGAPSGVPKFIMGLTPEEEQWAESFLNPHRIPEDSNLIGLQIGASFQQKCWPIPKWLTLIKKLSENPKLRLILFGDQSDRDRLDSHISDIPSRVISTVGDLSLRQLMALIQRCRIFIGADTGPLHLAVGLGLPVIALYGADAPQWTGPYGPRHRVHYKKLPCSPCYKKPTCQGRYDCLEAIGVDEVLDSVQEQLAGLNVKP
jgi:heptosyltransferase I